MSIGGVTRLPEVDRAALVREDVSWGLPEPAAAERVHELLERLRDVLRDGDGTVPAMRMVTERVAGLLG
ncbi:MULTISPECIES: hypothetical protein [Catenuloplanes]|uniref:Uncharacterized protein n=1 Tax=Catenuloplanes niger TaxID=587534 RepID=A0AAE4CQX4_9ACTN|nr:hypothetical protein [Catenuloplanes niger]MDR7320937.1 hypothetical protein [Catenuloplanes niger]